MFITGFVTRIKCAFRDKEMIFWTLLFPVMLATLFYFCFSNLDSADAFSPVKTAVVADQDYRQAAGFQAALEEVSKEGEDRLLQLTRVETREEADRLLEDGRVEGYLTIEAGAPKLTVRDDGLNQTILKSFLDQYLQISATAAHILERNPQAAQQGLLTDLMGQQEFTREISLSNAKPSHQLPYFYALIAMVCLYGSFQGLTSAFYLQANLSALGARRSMAPRKKAGDDYSRYAGQPGGASAHHAGSALLSAFGSAAGFRKPDRLSSADGAGGKHRRRLVRSVGGSRLKDQGGGQNRDFDYLEPGLLLPGGTDGGGDQLRHSAERAGGGLA